MAFWLLAPGRNGRPKAIVHLQHDLAYAAACHARNLIGLGTGDLCLSDSPLFTASGLCATIAFPFSVGAAAVTRSAEGRFAGLLASIGRFKPTVVFAPPGAFADILVGPTTASGRWPACGPA